MARLIQVEGKEYKVVENLGYSHGIGKYALVVLTEDKKEKVVTSYSTKGPWEFHKPLVFIRKNNVNSTIC